MNAKDETSAIFRRAVLGLYLAAIVFGAAPAWGQVDEETEHALGASQRSYKLLVPPGAKARKDMPLVVYLHASTDADFERVKRDYWPMLRDRTCILALPQSKGKSSWLAGEEKYVVDVIEDVQKRYGVDPKRLILLGVSGGGQVALFLVDHEPNKYRAVIVVSTNPVVVRGSKALWFYPNRETLKQCPYFVMNHITQGSALMYWRQVRAKLAPAGASVSILPVVGPVSHYLSPPPHLRGWLDEVLAGKHPAPLADPQEAAVAKMFKDCAAALPKAIEQAAAAAGAERIVKDGPKLRLTVEVPAAFERSKAEDESDAAGRPITQVRIEHKEWPIHVRCDARVTEAVMEEVLAAEETQTIQRGMLYQLYHSGTMELAGRAWRLKIGSITYPDRRRGWVSGLFIHAAAPARQDPKQWLEVMVLDETQQPVAAELATVLRGVIGSVTVAAAPATRPASSGD